MLKALLSILKAVRSKGFPLRSKGVVCGQRLVTLPRTAIQGFVYIQMAHTAANLNAESIRW